MDSKYIIARTAYIIYALVVGSCVAIKPGSYYSAAHKSEIILHKNNQFEYTHSFQFEKIHSSGAWRQINSRTIELNSFYQDRNLAVECSYRESQQNSIVLTLPKSVIGYWISAYVNDTVITQKIITEIVTIEYNKRVDSLRFGLSGSEDIPNRYLDTLFTSKFYQRRESCNHFKVLVNDSLFNYDIFSNEKATFFNSGIRLRNTLYRKT